MDALGVLAGGAGLIPYSDLRCVATPLAWLAGSVARVRRGHVETSVRHAGDLPPSAVASGMYASLAAGVMELLWLEARPRRLETVASFEGGARERLEEALAAGRGAVLAASHTGNWELSACALARSHGLAVLVKGVRVGAFDRFMRRLRARYGVELLEGEGALAAARARLREGKLVAVLVDQVPPGRASACRVAFLGRGAWTDRSAAALAASAGAPLVTTASRRCADGRHVLSVLGVRVPPADEPIRAFSLRATAEVTRELDAFVRRYPDQWLWLHRRWRPPFLARPDGGA